MFGRFLPRETIFFDFFEQHARITLEAAQTLLHLMTGNQILFEEGVDSPIKDLEHQADKVTFHCVEALHKSFITPFQQNDIYCLISSMDDIIDSIDEAFDDCIIYKIQTPTPAAKELVRLLVSAAEKVNFIIIALRERRKQSSEIRNACLQIDEIKNEADKIYRKALGQLFDEEQDIRFIIKWKEVYAALEEAVDNCDDVSSIVQGIMLEYD